MSLDVMLCNSVPPRKANRVYEMALYPALRRRFQRTGLLNVQERRIGRSCMSKSWLKEYSKIENQNDLRDFCTVFPEDVIPKLLRRLYIKPELVVSGRAFFDYDAVFVRTGQPNGQPSYDFIYISW
jgi:hypothetical protein